MYMFFKNIHTLDMMRKNVNIGMPFAAQCAGCLARLWQPSMCTQPRPRHVRVHAS